MDGLCSKEREKRTCDTNRTSLLTDRWKYSDIYNVYVIQGGPSDQTLSNISNNQIKTFCSLSNFRHNNDIIVIILIIIIITIIDLLVYTKYEYRRFFFRLLLYNSIYYIFTKYNCIKINLHIQGYLKV